MTPPSSSKMARPPPIRAAWRSCHRTLCTGSSESDGTSSGLIAVSSDSSAMRADRLDDRTAENVATASTRVPPAVANEAMEVQSAMRSHPIDWRLGPDQGPAPGQRVGEGPRGRASHWGMAGYSTLWLSDPGRTTRSSVTVANLGRSHARTAVSGGTRVVGLGGV